MDFVYSFVNGQRNVESTSYIKLFEYIVLSNIIMGLQTQKCKILWKVNFQKSAYIVTFGALLWHVRELIGI